MKSKLTFNFHKKVKEDIAKIKISKNQTELVASDYQQNLSLPHVPVEPTLLHTINSGE